MKEKYPGIAEALAIMRPSFIPAHSLGLIYANSFFSAFQSTKGITTLLISQEVVKNLPFFSRM